MSASRVLLIVNPVSGKMRSKTGLFSVIERLYGDPKAGEPCPDRLVTVCPTRYRGHATELARRAAEDGFDVVVCCGGDGTLNETLNGLMAIPPGQRPELGYIPAGSTNDFAAGLGLPQSLRAATAAAAGGKTTPVDAGLFSPIGNEGLADRHFAYIASFGAFTATSYSTPQAGKNLMGYAAYLLNGIKDLGSLHPRDASVELADGTRLEGPYVFGAVANTASAGGIVRLPPAKVSVSDGLLEVLLIRHPRNMAELSRIVSSLLSSSFEDNPLTEFRHTSEARFSLSEARAWSLDGEEVFGGTRIRVSCVRHAFRLRVP